MSASFGLFAHKHKLALLLGEPGLEDRNLVASGRRNTKLGRLAIEHIGGHRIGGHADPVELAPSQRFDGTRLLGGNELIEHSNVVSRHFLRAYAGDQFIDRGRRGRRRLGWWQRMLGIVASRVGCGDAVINAVEIVKLRFRRPNGR